jgi:hypothetical protein
MSKMKFVFELMESGTYQAFECQAMLAAERGERHFQFGNAIYDVEFAANVMAYIYQKLEQQQHEQYLLYLSESGTNSK